MSGGFDSSLLAYLVFTHVREIKFDGQITVFVVPRHDGSVNHVSRVLNVLPSGIKYHHKIVGNPDLHHSRQVWSGMIEASAFSDVLWIADTKNPHHLIGGPNRPVIFRNNEYHPFLNYNKTITVQIAHHLQILDLISNVSHTCTERVNERCEICWQCRERSWAFESLDLIDTGKM